MKGKQLKLELKEWGGRRKGSGRKNRSGLKAHLKREKLPKATPLHITFKLRPGLHTLRLKLVLKFFKRASRRANELFGLRIVHFALLSNHLHLFVETKDNRTLTSGMKSFAISLARFILPGTRAKAAFLGR